MTRRTPAGGARGPRSRAAGSARPGGTRSAAPRRAPTRPPKAPRAREPRRSPGATTRAAAGPRRRRGRRLLVGDRLYVLLLGVVLVVIAAMAVGPLQSYTAAADRVDELTATRDRLAAEVDALADRRDRLRDPEEVELLARSKLGLIKPGEVPYLIVTDEPGVEDFDVREPDDGPPQDVPWYRRLGRSLAELVN